MGLFGEAVEIRRHHFPSIAAIVQAYKKDRDVNILSTPQLLTTDNQEASITVGSNIPFQTTTSTTDNDTYNSYEYRDVGKTLKITPQINKDRMVRLNLSLEVSALESTTDFRPTTLKRTVETTVMVKDGSTVVIGGLIDDTFSQTEYKVPCLGDIPGLGWLFKTRSKGSEKSNLFIFITPRVIQNPGEAASVSKSKKTEIDGLREMQIKLYRGGIEEMGSPSVENMGDFPDRTCG
jgi:general secretion pathway protein D